jgi:hypothetical protein
MLRSSTFLREQLRLRKAVEARRLQAIGGEPTLEENPFDYYAHRRAQERIAEIQQDLAAAEGAGPLEFEFEGHDIYSHAIALRRFENLVRPLAKTLRWTAHDHAMLDGVELVPGTTITALAEPVLTGTFGGSFGVRVDRPPLPENLSLFGSLFDRTAERVVTVFRTARDTDDPAEIVASVAGLRKRAIQGFQELALAITGAAAIARVRWQGAETIAVSSVTAAAVVDALSSIRMDEETITLVGTLTGGDVSDERFHLVVEDESGRRRDVRGNVEPELVSQLKDIHLGSRVQATVTVTYTESDLLGTTRPPMHVLTDIRLLGEGVH